MVATIIILPVLYQSELTTTSVITLITIRHKQKRKYIGLFKGKVQNFKHDLIQVLKWIHEESVFPFLHLQAVSLRAGLTPVMDTSASRFMVNQVRNPKSKKTCFKLFKSTNKFVDYYNLSGLSRSSSHPQVNYCVQKIGICWSFCGHMSDLATRNWGKTHMNHREGCGDNPKENWDGYCYQKKR